jgi:hypothetical protein
MKKQRAKIFLVASAWLVTFVVLAGNAEPSYQGHTLTEWADQINPEEAFIAGKEPPAYNAIRQIGTNAIPSILKWLSTGPLQRARTVYFILGEKLSPAVPDITRLALHLKEYKRFDDCVEALGCIGPAAVPGFKMLLTKGRPEVQFSAIEYLPMLHTNVVELLPAIVKCMVGKNDEVGGKAASILGELEIPHSVLIPALTHALRTASGQARLRIFRCFLFMRPPLDNEDKDALSYIRAALNDPNKEIASTAYNIMSQVEPQRFPKKSL